MYFPIGWHKVLNLDLQSNQAAPCNILSIQANHERELFFILTSKSIHIWFPRPTVEIVCHRRSEDSIEHLGLNRSAIWKTDSSVIVVATDKDQLLFYQIRHRSSTSKASAFMLPSSADHDSIYKLKNEFIGFENILTRESRKELSNVSSSRTEVPALTIFSFGKLDLSSIGVSCLMSAEEELIVGARNGHIYGVFWNGNVDDKFPWSLSQDVVENSDFVIDIKFSSILSGFSIVLNSGRTGFLPLKSPAVPKKGETDKFGNDSKPRLNFLTAVNDATCTEINHKYRLVAIGLKNSKVIVCNIDDTNLTLVENHELELQASKFPHDSTRLGSINCLRYSPDSSALVTSWQCGGFAIWSVFGSLLFCTQQWQLESASNALNRSIKISCLAWSREGFNLWLSQTNEFDSIETNGHPTLTRVEEEEKLKESISSSLDLSCREDVVIITLAKSNLSSSPHLTCSSDAIILISDDRLYVGPSVPHEAKFDHWFTIDVPQAYLNLNYPIRYATVDRECQNIAIAGSRGFALYSIKSSKWKFFSRKSNEESFCVCGDMIWWNYNYVVISCFNFENDSFELRTYFITNETSLDNSQTFTQVTSMEIIRMSIFENRILVLYSDGTLSMFMLNLRRKQNLVKKKLLKSSGSNEIERNNDAESNENQTRTSRSGSMMSSRSVSIKKDYMFKDNFLDVQISSIDNLIISNLLVNSYCISSIALSRLHFNNNRLDDSILLNACGKLFLLEREIPSINSTLNANSSSTSQSSTASEINSDTNDEILSSNNKSSKSTNVAFKAISVIATNVEQFWISPEISEASEMSYFKKSLWLYCGGLNNQLQVWLPLLNDKLDPPTDLYVPDRIMLPIKCDIYPLAIRSSAPNIVEPDDAIVLGAESDILYQDNGSLFSHFPYNTVKRQCRVYLHRILRELLLAQHLGYYARKIAESCQSLPYFAHCFELLLHEVLEEEATSPVPIPDPMLPQIVRFIKEFPVYLETVVHCARKSELSMWSHLFDERAVGNPRRLFQECMDSNKLDIAASCLIILQSLDKNIVSQKMIRQLIKAARENVEYQYLIEDLESFLTRAELEYSSPCGSSSSPT